MTALAAANGARLLPAHAAMWRIDPSSTTFELSVYHDLALIRATKSFRRVDGLLVRDQTGNVRIGITLDTATLEPAPNDTDPRRGSYKLFPGPQAAHPLALFASTGATFDGEGTLRVAGELVVGAVCVPLELDVDVAGGDNALHVTASLAVDHRRLGLAWVPAGALRAPSRLVVRARLFPTTDRHEPGSTNGTASSPDEGGRNSAGPFSPRRPAVVMTRA